MQMSRRRHPDKEIEAALRYAEAYGWQIVATGHHGWGKLYCPTHSAACRCGEFCISVIWSTPRNVFHHARALRRVVNKCIAVRQLH